MRVVVVVEVLEGAIAGFGGKEKKADDDVNEK
jgi:hypothetical protein